MSGEWSYARLESLISNQIEENIGLEYKGPAALVNNDKNKNELTKDISAMANSDGGNVIYGILEDPNRKHFPEKIEPLDRRKTSKEWIEQILQNIHPKIEGLRIHPIPVPESPDLCCYVVEVPQGETAHQAGDRRYYRRHNFIAESMWDFEIRDVMNRRKVPRVEITVRVHIGKQKRSNNVFARVENLSSVFARHCALVIRFPFFIQRDYVRFKGYSGNTNSKGFSSWRLTTKFSDSPLFPEGTLEQEFNFEFPVGFRFEGDPPRSTSFLDYTFWADSMPPRKGKVELEHITKIQQLID